MTEILIVFITIITIYNVIELIKNIYTVCIFFNKKKYIKKCNDIYLKDFKSKINKEVKND
jgi:hypothetical protein